ncbi:MAG: energy-coupling factor transporter ATPase [Sporolactobacillus sp.]
MGRIELRGISYTYSKKTSFEKKALNHLSLTIENGDYLGIIGHTGSGKSTLIRHLNGLLRPDEGSIWLDGKNIWQNPAQIRSIRFQIGVVFQYPEMQIFEDTVAKDIAYGPKNIGLDKEQIDQRVGEALSFVGLNASYSDRNPFRLSGGEMRRVAIAGVIAMNPQVLVLDEPTAGLDPDGRDQLYAQIDAYRQQTGRTIILVSHSMEEIAQRASHVLVLQDGQAAMYGSTREIFAQANKLHALGLDVPQITRVLEQLQQAGYPVSTEALTLDQAEQEILRLFKERRPFE